jgi:hypothetical protein
MVFDIAQGTVGILDRRTGEFRSADELLHDAAVLAAPAER